jgi:dihydropteroate synthase
MHGRVWQLTPSKQVPLPAVMAILNATPDSFYAGSRHPTLDTALAAINAGAAILDIGPESTRPGSEPIPADEQIRRAIPLIVAVRAADPNIAITIDTTSAQVAAAALDAGADAINDISAGRDDPQMFPLAAARACGLILMHRLVIPKQDRYSDQYASGGATDAAPIKGDVVKEITAFLLARAAAAQAAGVASERIVLDPGLGFGKTVEQNLELIQRTPEIAALGYPILSGLSRKSFVGRAHLHRDSAPEERLPGTLALSRQHLARGASILRVHDVPEHMALLQELDTPQQG